MKKKIGLLGGSFDPIHQAHLQLGVAAKCALSLDEVWILVDKNPRGKLTQTSFEHRLHMAKLAANLKPGFYVDKQEIQTEGRTHDHKTLLDLRSLFPSYEFTMILGFDAAARFHMWDRPDIFCENASFAVAMRRPHTEEDMNKLLENLGPLAKRFAYKLLDFPLLDTSSSVIRNDFLSKNATSDLEPEVHSYILEQQLYSTTE